MLVTSPGTRVLAKRRTARRAAAAADPRVPGRAVACDAECTPFRPRPELDRLHEWCQADSRSSTRLVVGPSGQGKTRLAGDS